MNCSVCLHVLFNVNGCNFNIKTLKPSMTEQDFFSFFFSMVTVLDLNKISNESFKIRGILYIKEKNFDCKYVSCKTY